jgi:hypothetical protein
MLSSALVVSGRPRKLYRSGQRVAQRLIEKKLRGAFGEHRAGRTERSDHDMNARLYFDRFIGIDACGISVPNSEYRSRRRQRHAHHVRSEPLSFSSTNYGLAV